MSLSTKKPQSHYLDVGSFAAKETKVLIEQEGPSSMFKVNTPFRSVYELEGQEDRVDPEAEEFVLVKEVALVFYSIHGSEPQGVEAAKKLEWLKATTDRSSLYSMLQSWFGPTFNAPEHHARIEKKLCIEPPSW